jgi:hypothetical protein
MQQPDSKSTPQSDPTSSAGKYSKYFQAETVQQCGYIMLTMAVFMLLGGAIVETLSFAKLYGEHSLLRSDTYSFISYAGYWCGGMVSHFNQHSICT